MGSDGPEPEGTQKVLDFWMQERPTLRLSLRAASRTEEKNQAGGGPCAATIFARAVRHQWSLMAVEDKRAWAAAAATGGPAPGQSKLWPDADQAPAEKQGQRADKPQPASTQPQGDSGARCGIGQAVAGTCFGCGATGCELALGQGVHAQEAYCRACWDQRGATQANAARTQETKPDLPAESAGEAPWKKLRLLTASTVHGAAAAPQPTQWNAAEAAEKYPGGAVDGTPGVPSATEWPAHGVHQAGGWEAPGYGAAVAPEAAAWSAQSPAWTGCPSAAASWAAQPVNAQYALPGSGLQPWDPGYVPAGAPAVPGSGSAVEGAHQQIAREAPAADVGDPLFPEFNRLRGQDSSAEGRAQSGQEEEEKRYDRFLRLLPDGSLPSDRTILYWASTVPAGNPLLRRGAEWHYLPKDKDKGKKNTRKVPIGLVLQFGKKHGAVHIWMRKSGKIHIAGSTAVRESILSKMQSWTAPYNNGVPPSGPTDEPLPPLPPAAWTAP